MPALDNGQTICCLEPVIRQRIRKCHCRSESANNSRFHRWTDSVRSAGGSFAAVLHPQVVDYGLRKHVSPLPASRLSAIACHAVRSEGLVHLRLETCTERNCIHRLITAAVVAECQAATII